MKAKIIILLCVCATLVSFTAPKGGGKTRAIHSGVAWFDRSNREVNAHGACIVKEGDLYYLFGECHTDTSNAFIGFSCYSSPDLMNWQFEKLVLPLQKEGLLGPNRVGERVKVMKCPTTGEFVMYMHTDNLFYKDPHIGYATCQTINGDYQFQGELLHNGKYLHRWDMGTFQDTDGKGYLLTHEGFIYELTDDYKSVKRIMSGDIAHGGESPAMFKKDGTYFWMFSNKTSWERNDNYYFTSASLEGPWVKQGLFAPEGTLTWNSQCSFVFPIVNGTDTLHLYMGDRWSYPRQGTAATQVWQPITVQDGKMSIPTYQDAWAVKKASAQWQAVSSKTKSIQDKAVIVHGSWEAEKGTQRSKEKGATISYTFKGKQIGLKAVSNTTSGYASLTLRNSKNEVVLHTNVDFYSLYAHSAQKFLSPVLANDTYTLTIEVLGEHPKWSDKTRANYGSTNDYVIIEDVFTVL